jgi:hypothetical protein
MKILARARREVTIFFTRTAADASQQTLNWSRRSNVRLSREAPLAPERVDNQSRFPQPAISAKIVSPER